MIKECFQFVATISFPATNTSMINMIDFINVAQYSDEIEISPNMKKVKAIYSDLGYTNPTVIEIANDIIAACVELNKNDIIISKTGDNEILIYREVEGEFRNLIIDENGDVEFLFVPIQRRDTYNEYYSFAMVNANDLANKL